MSQFIRITAYTGCLLVIAGCGSVSPPKYENGQYVPPPSEHALAVELLDSPCGTNAPPKALLTPLLVVAGTALISQGYDRFVNWLDEKKANLSASSSGVTTTNFLVGKTPKGCLRLRRSDDLEAQFLIEPTTGGYWHMKPYSLRFIRSEAKEKPDGVKNIVADIQFSSPAPDGKLETFFQATFDLGKHKPSDATYSAASFVGQDSGPFGLPKVPAGDPQVTMKVTASLIEHGEGRDWIRGVTDAMREQENKDKILKPILDLLGKKGT